MQTPLERPCNLLRAIVGNPSSHALRPDSQEPHVSAHSKHRPTSWITLLLLLALTPLLHAQQHPDPPAWVHNKTLYEVNLRQFSEQGTVNALREQLPRLKATGIDILWIMPVHPIGVEKRAGTLGSPYAVSDYKAFNPEFGTIDDFKQLVAEAHDLGMYVIIDWVANHTAWDHPWIQQHPDWYTRDEQGAIIPPIPLWADVADLNYDKPELREAMIDAMAFWVRETDIDGFRCDTAEWLPLDFWVDARIALWQIKPVFILAEGNKPELVNNAFDAAYAWDLTPNFEAINHGEKTAHDLANYLNAENRVMAGDGFRLNFTTNHDINAWEGTTAQRLGDGLEAFTVITWTARGMPLIYNGQEAGMTKQLEFFERDPIIWQTHRMALLYRSLAEIRRKHTALHAGNPGGSLRIIDNLSNEHTLVYERSRDNDRVVVMLNLSDTPQTIRRTDLISGLTPELVEGVRTRNDNLILAPWAYAIWATE